MHPSAVASRKRRERHPDREFSRALLLLAIKRGDVIRGDCARKDAACSGRIEGHHKAYGRGHSLDVVWLCVFHHHQVHREARQSAPEREVSRQALSVSREPAQ